MKKLFKVLFLGLMAISMVGCNNKSNDTKPSDGDADDDNTVNEVVVPDIKVDISTDTKSIITNKEYTLTATYDDKYFKADDKVFNKDLATLSLVASCATASKERINKLYQDISYESVFLSESYNEEPTTNSIAFSFANRGKVVSIAIRGFEYKKEWANNFKIGLEGNHLGFEESAQKVYTELKTYLADHKLNNSKIWLTGYSRGGAVANLLSSMILEDHDISLDAFYGYTFEAPKGVLKENAKDYKNLFNLVNSADPVQYLALEEFNFARNGVDIEIFNPEVATLLSSFNEELKIDAFISMKDYAETPDQLPQAIINDILKFAGDGNIPSSKDRKEFLDNYSEQIGYIVSLIFMLSDEVLENIKNDVSKMTLLQLMNLLNADGLYDFITPYLTDAKVAYVGAILYSSIQSMLNFVKGPALNIVSKALDKDNQKDFVFMLYMHDPLSTYVLLQNYEVK